MTTLATHPVEDPDQLALYADHWTPLGKPFADAFRDVCEAIAHENGGRVNPNLVRERMLEHPDYEPRRYSAMWVLAGARDGFLRKTDELVQISGEGSLGNTNKSVLFREWVGDPAP